MLVLDVEQGSVGAGLVRLAGQETPRLFGQTLYEAPLLTARNSDTIAREIEKGVREALGHESLFAARVRNTARGGTLGTIHAVSVFLGAPWGVPNLTKGAPDFSDPMRNAITAEVLAFFGDVPITFHTSAEGGTYSFRALGRGDSTLLALVRAEITELVFLRDTRVAGYATIPQGSHLLARTLRTHGGVSATEACSAIELAYDAPHVREPLQAGMDQFASALANLMPALIGTNEAPNIVVLARGRAGERFAQGLSQSEPMAAVFPQGGSVQALRPNHFAPHIVHQAPADLFLLVDALFADKKFSV